MFTKLRDKHVQGCQGALCCNNDLKHRRDKVAFQRLESDALVLHRFVC